MVPGGRGPGKGAGQGIDPAKNVRRGSSRLPDDKTVSQGRKSLRNGLKCEAFPFEVAAPPFF